MNIKQSLCVAVVLSSIGIAPALAFDDAAALPVALGAGKPDLDVRLRYESVDQDNFSDKGEATSVRARLGYTTGHWNDFDGQVEFEGTAALGSENYNSTDNGNSQYPVIPDPTGSEFNQYWIRYSGLPDTAIKIGRQRIIYDNARFVGNVGWRQKEQTYDGVSLTGTWLPKLTFNYAYLSNIKSFRYFPINGVNTDNIDLDGAQLINLAYKAKPWLAVSGYGYLLNFAYDPPTTTLNNPRRDTATAGLRVTGSVPLKPLNLSYALEYAHQSDYADAPKSIDANYYLVEAGAAYSKFSAKLGFEVLGGDGHYAFQTPLATLHAFQGWDDQFLVTPAAGVEDFYISLGGGVEKVKLLAVWHDYNANDSSGSRYGSEIDLQATRPLGKNFVLGLKYAGYTADNYPSAAGKPYDTTKFWTWLEYKL